MAWERRCGAAPVTPCPRIYSPLRRARCFMKPSLTVVTASLNAAACLPALLHSLRSQADRDFDFIVMDGGSRDGTLALLEASPDLVTHVSSQPDHGFYDALNHALRLIQTDYYLVLGADDVLYPDAIANFKMCAADQRADMVVAQVKAGRRLLKGYRPHNAWLGPGHMFTSHSVGTLLRTSLHQRLGNYSYRYAIYADSLFMKNVAQTPGLVVCAGDFIAGEFNPNGGFSRTNFVRSLCELWMMQRETGENALLQYGLFQARLLWNLPRVLRA